MCRVQRCLSSTDYWLLTASNSGFSYLRLRSPSATRLKARIVIVSQWESPELREAAKESGAMAYVNKKSLIPLRDIIEAG